MAQLFGMPRLSARCHKCLIEATQLRMTCQEPQEKGKNGLVRVHTNRRLITMTEPYIIFNSALFFQKLWCISLMPYNKWETMKLAGSLQIHHLGLAPAQLPVGSEQAPAPCWHASNLQRRGLFQSPEMRQDVKLHIS